MNVLRAREWMARQTIQLHQPLASPSWLLPLNKRQPSGLQQFANSIMKESNQPFPTVAKNSRLSKLSCLNKRPFLETLLLTGTLQESLNKNENERASRSKIYAKLFA